MTTGIDRGVGRRRAVSVEIDYYALACADAISFVPVNARHDGRRLAPLMARIAALRLLLAAFVLLDAARNFSHARLGKIVEILMARI